jgi:GT2 family glycosyltransferase
VSGTAPVSVVIPTVGRRELLSQCLRSLERCDPRPAEVIVVDQSGDSAVAEVAERFGARLVVLPDANVARARNLGLREAREAVMLFTDDDCTVTKSWVGAAAWLMREDGDRIVTGRVLGQGADVPSLREADRRHDYTGERRCEVLFTGNMAADRLALLEFGGFDERFTAAAEDMDLCYRWLRAGRKLVFEPELVVWHHGWRRPEELADLYRRYWSEQAAFYAKHLRRGDAAILRFFVRDAVYAMAALGKAAVRREPLRLPALRLALLVRGVAGGVLRGA